MNWDKIGELCQYAAILTMIANDLLLQRRMRQIEKKLLEMRVDIMAESIQKAIEPELRTWGMKKEDDHGAATR